MVIRALDISQPSPKDWWLKVRETRDVKLAIIRCWRGSNQQPRDDGFLESEGEKARNAGLAVAAYCWPPSQLWWATAFIQGVTDDLVFLAADQEAGARTLTTALMAPIAAAGIEPWVYTSAGSWGLTMAGVPESLQGPLGQFPLWLARYPFRAEGTVWGKRYREWWPSKLAPETHAEILGAGFGSGHGGPFGARENVGPWNRRNPPLGWQHTGTCRLEGHDCDLNIFEEEILEGVSLTPQPGTETEDEVPYTEADRNRDNLVRWTQAARELLERYASTLDEAAAAIRTGDKLPLDLIIRAEEAMSERALED